MAEILKRDVQNPSISDVLSQLENSSILDILNNLNKNQVFKIEQRGRKFFIKHEVLEEWIRFPLDTIPQAIEFRKILKTIDIANESCLKREELDKCILVKPEKTVWNRWVGNTNDLFRVEDGVVNRFLMKNPVFYREMLHSFVPWEKIPNNISDTIRNYMNLIMSTTQSR